VSWGCSAWRREGSRETLEQPFSIKRGGYKEDGEGHFTRACSDRTRGNSFEVKEGRFSLRVRKRFFSVRVVETLEWVAQRSCGCSIAGSVQGRAGWGFEQPGLVEDVPAYGRGVGTR